MKKAEATNFLQLIKHMSKSKDLHRSFEGNKKSKKEKYGEQQNQQQQSYDKKKQRKSLNCLEFPPRNKSANELYYKIPSIIHELSREPRIKYIESSDSLSIENSPDQMGKKLRSNMYENYCEMIKKKRNAKLNKMLKGSPQESTTPVYNMSNAAKFQPNENGKYANNERVLTKNKTYQPGHHSLKTKYNEENDAKYYGNMDKRRQQPHQLTIQHVDTFTMPKIDKKFNRYLSSKRQHQKVSRILQSKKREKIINNLEGWVLLDQKPFFNVDLF